MPAPTSSLGALQRSILASESESCIFDLVAEPAPFTEPPGAVPVGGATIRVESPLGLLTQKLCTLLGRAEPRGLDDAGRLLDAGVDFDAAAALAAVIVGGFSPLTLAWVLERWDLPPIATAGGYGAAAVARLDRVRRPSDRLTA